MCFSAWTRCTPTEFLASRTYRLPLARPFTPAPKEPSRSLINYGADALRIELVLAMLEAARDKDTP